MYWLRRDVHVKLQSEQFHIHNDSTQFQLKAHANPSPNLFIPETICPFQPLQKTIFRNIIHSLEERYELLLVAAVGDV